MYKLFIALRYLKRRIITYIAIAGVSVGVMVLVIVLSVMGGFQREFHEKIRGTMADIIITQEEFGMTNHDEIIKKVSKIPGPFKFALDFEPTGKDALRLTWWK